ncbi:hypothetical protein AWC38_SpisGene7885 [Stylophora pistillata]|uniref:C2H2-type domain-containing protein n=1 Tax=Stylophora pistillata TaxID=50429 RepID=A0A2B4SFQ1_STYPI|nr:hypothetical protein AWC38_SpisGene7885 [Stylophora pistillata]
MADGADYFLLWGDDFEVILDILGDETVKQQFIATVNNVQQHEIICKDCGKKYKTKGGYERHRSLKHSSLHEGSIQPLSVSILAEVLASAIRKINETEVFRKSLRDELSKYSFQQPEERGLEFTGIKSITGTVESQQAMAIPVKSTQFFTGLSRNAATLLSTRVANCLIAYCKRSKNSGDNYPTTTVLSERERAGLQYLGGYVLHNLYKKHARTGTVESQQAMAILKAGKLDSINDSKQSLISGLNRGGLWSITEPARKIFVVAEHYFHQLTQKVASQGIGIVTITLKATSDSDVLSNYGLIITDQGCIASHYDFVCTGTLILLHKRCD